MPILNIASMIFAIVLHFWHLQTKLVGVETTRLRLCSGQMKKFERVNTDENSTNHKSIGSDCDISKTNDQHSLIVIIRCLLVLHWENRAAELLLSDFSCFDAGSCS